MDDLIKCLAKLERLKTIERTCSIGSRKESTAEHTWSSMMIADIVLDFIDEPLDRAKVLEIILYHDLVEVYAGDAKFNNPEQMQGKKEREEVAFKKILGMIPNKKRYQALNEEYEKRETRESQFAKAIDCIEPEIQNLNEKGKPRDTGFDEALLRKTYSSHVEKFEFTKQLFEQVIQKLKEQDKI